jgi:hypothetical protein
MQIPPTDPGKSVSYPLLLLSIIIIIIDVYFQDSRGLTAEN